MKNEHDMIELTDITKTYVIGDIETQALRGVSFSIKAGEFVAIMGPSGSGKSTLMHIMGALDTPTSGTYKLDGRNISSYSEDELADIRSHTIGFVFQAFNLLPRATVLRNVMLPLVYADMPYEERRTHAANALRAVVLDEARWHHHSNELSGGQRQRVAIARALVNDPKLILADEPTGNLDTKTGDAVLATLQELNEKDGHTIVLITHEPEVAAHADRIIHIRDGCLEKDEKISRRRATAHKE